MKKNLLISLAIGLAITQVGLADEPASLGRNSDSQNVQTSSRSRVDSPYWNNGGSYGGNTLTAPLGDLPAADIRAVPPARAAAVQAKWTFFQLQQDLNNATRMLVNKLERDPAYKKSQVDETEAYNQMQSARTNALAELDTNDHYVAAKHLHDLLNDQLAELHDQEKPDQATIVATAKVKLSYVADNRKLESSVLARDPAYQDARKKYIAAARLSSDLRDQIALAVAEDQSLVELRKQIGQARIARISTEAYLDSTVVAANVAIQYARFYRSQDIYHGNTVSSPWDNSNSGYYPGGVRVVGY